ncbi:unnamed protein product [Caenorhabditis angaria]|uniref:Deltamethrin resistance protein prag01 domain-containing protein n=1 Tax=Caenorhabditis angaria TaxID=860376 RepID=A0A9P1MYY3_9PELO|nr:unnamed protein product [Caenorhabditis angaria]
MNRAVVSRFLALRKVVQKRNGSGGHHANPGPPCTFDHMPVPFQPYGKVHGELQSKFNTYLAVSAIFFVSSFATALYTNLFAFEQAIRPPQSYRNRH